MTILNLKNIDPKTNPILLGEPLGLSRHDSVKYPQFLESFKKQLEMFWRPEEISLDKDRVDFSRMEEHEKFIFTSNLLYQTMMDSVISRGAGSFIQYVTNPELESAMRAWEFFETIHAYSYSYIIKNVYADPRETFDRALEDAEIVKRAIASKETYEELTRQAEKPVYSMNNTKKMLYKAFISVNILEAVRFYVSFVCSFAFGENKKMNGNAEIIKLIRRDEGWHYALSQQIINILRTREDEGFVDIASAFKDEAIQMFLDGAKEEKEWANYIFSRGSIRGLNEKILSDYIEWLTDSRMQAIGLPKQFGTKNPIGGWLEPWMNSSSVQVAPQEHEVTSYRINASKADMGNMDYEGLL